MNLRHEIGAWGLSLQAEQGQAWLGSWHNGANVMRQGLDRFDIRSMTMEVDRQVGPLAASLGLSWLDEDRTILGGYFHEAFGTSGADTLFVDAAASLRLADGWTLGADLRRGYTRVRRSDFISAGSDVQSTAWSVDLARSGVLQGGDSLGLRVSQPLRIEKGGLMLSLPVAYDYATETARYGLQNLPLAPDGRELTGEIAWSGKLWGGSSAASLFYRRQPGHYAAVPDDAGVAVKWSGEF